MIHRGSDRFIPRISGIIVWCGSFNYSLRRNWPECVTGQHPVAIRPNASSFAASTSATANGDCDAGMPSVCGGCAITPPARGRRTRPEATDRAGIRGPARHSSGRVQVPWNGVRYPAPGRESRPPGVPRSVATPRRRPAITPGPPGSHLSPAARRSTPDPPAGHRSPPHNHPSPAARRSTPDPPAGHRSPACRSPRAPAARSPQRHRPAINRRPTGRAFPSARRSPRPPL